jgi:adrenodoxin-NADP+ reductase
MEDAFTTADAIVHDWSSGARFLADGHAETKPGWEGVLSEQAKDNATIVQWKDWQKIDQAERERGRASGKEREKFATAEEMLAVVR